MGLKNIYKSGKRKVSKSLNIAKASYKKAKPTLKKISRKSREIEGNISYYFDTSIDQMQGIAKRRSKR